MATLRNSAFLTRLIDPFRPTSDGAEAAYRFEAGSRPWALPAIVGAALLLVSFIGWATQPEQFYLSYLLGWVFCLTLSIGALFFVIIQHLTKARWSTVLRRLAEGLLWAFPILFVLSIPLWFGLHDLYHWTHHELVVEGGAEYDPIIAGKAIYLNVPFFAVRVVVYFAVWSLIAFLLTRLSLREDVTGDHEVKFKQRKVSAWALPVMAVTTAFASYDLLMSMDPHWFSTIFGVYFFAGAFLSIHALLALTAIVLQRRPGLLRGVVTKEHYQDLGKWMFGFTVFWAYIAFSQYMLIWYGNLPEETLWYRHRLEHGWQYHSAALLILHFIIPFFVLLPRFTKRSIPVMSVMAIWILVMQWFDLHWLAAPALKGHHAGFHWLDFTCWFGLTALFVAGYLYRIGRHSLVPRRDPWLPASLRFENA